jgi:hypothetical protein
MTMTSIQPGADRPHDPTPTTYAGPPEGDAPREGARGCTATKADGSPCDATRLRDVPLCFHHDPASAEAAAEARRLGGSRRRQEQGVLTALDLPDPGSLDGLARLHEVATFDTLALRPSVGRSRTLVALVQLGLELREARDREDRQTSDEARLKALEASLHRLPARTAGTSLLADAENYRRFLS